MSRLTDLKNLITMMHTHTITKSVSHGKVAQIAPNTPLSVTYPEYTELPMAFAPIAGTAQR